ncbi:putative transposable element [Pseudoloma neurophilia]|uniref:Putative transposable element n=1 Tax=Pseudoloma neurophilia TaxID=146866 RepID=A0A0R0LVB4_9MICR|nr:putative transposable element [Pseudoloma neurophilia]
MRMEELYVLFKNEKKFIFTDEARNSLEMIKNEVIKNKLLVLPDLHEPFIVYTDAFQIGTGAALVKKIVEI